MADAKGITIQFRGDTTDFEKSVKTINGELKKTKSDISTLNKELKFNPKNVEALTKKFDALQQKEKQLTELTKTLQEGMKNFDPNSREWDNYNRQLQRASADLQNLRNELSKLPSANVQVLSQNFTEFGKKLNDVGGKLESIGNKLSVLSVGVLGLGTAGIKFNAQLEQYQTAFTTLIGDAEQAEKAISKIQQGASLTPFSTESLIEANQYLISAGVEADEAYDFIMALGDAISATGGGSNELSRMAQNLQQVKNLGKASSVDIKQFANAGINIYGLLADTTGKSVEQLKEMDITYEELFKAFKQSSSEGGKYFGAMETQAQTINGSISTLKDSISQLLGELTQDLLPIVKDILQYINDFIKRIKALNPQQKSLITQIGGFVALLGPVTKFLGIATTKFGELSINIGNLLKSEKVVSLFAKLTANGTSLGAVFKTLVKVVAKFVNPLTVAVGVLAVLYAKNEDVREAVNDLAKALGGLFKSTITTVVAILKTMFAIIGQVLNVLNRLWQSFANSQAGQGFITFLRNVINMISNVINWFKSLIDWLGKAFNWFSNLIGIATDFNNTTITSRDKLNGHGTDVEKSGGFMNSGGMMSSNITMNNTFTITNGAGITEQTVERWADILTGKINNNLGRMI